MGQHGHCRLRHDIHAHAEGARNLAGVGGDQRVGVGDDGGGSGTPAHRPVVWDGERDGKQHAARGDAHARYADWAVTIERCAERVRDRHNPSHVVVTHDTIGGEVEFHDR